MKTARGNGPLGLGANPMKYMGLPDLRIENNVIPSGDTLSPFMSLSQMSNASQSYTPGINYLEVAFSPQNEINEDIMSVTYKTIFDNKY